MSDSHDAIGRVLAAFERSDWAEIDVRVGDVRVHLSTRSSTGAHRVAQAEPTGTADQAPLPAAIPDSETKLDPSAEGADGAHVVVAPSPGICWRAPEPGAPPFTEVGAEVTEASTLCIVEVMKLMNHLKAPIAGTVLAVYGRDGVAVAKGEPLFAIRPRGSS